MRILKVEMTGFKSYRTTKVVEFHEGINVVVGENGKGKSNVYDAIRFVLGDQFGNLRASKGTDLLNEGVSSRVMSAEVKITLDNSDGRLPLDASEVTVGRVVGVKKDEYFLAGKVVKKGDVASLLDSAGFSRSNPYYIVAQGKVQALTRMSDGDRLQLLKEVAGTSIYEERRKESLAILEDTDSKRRGIQDVLGTIDERIEALEGEMAELQQLVALDRRRRALEYSLYSSELKKADNELAEVADQLNSNAADGSGEGGSSSALTDGSGGGGSAEALRQSVEEADKTVKGIEAQLRELGDRLRELEAEKKNATDALPGLAKSRTRASHKVSELERKLHSQATSQKEAQAEVAALTAKMEQLKKQLEDTFLPAASKAQRAYDDLKSSAGAAQAKIEAMHNKAGRIGEHKTKKARDDAINKELGMVKATLKAKLTMHETLKSNITEREGKHTANIKAAEEAKLRSEKANEMLKSLASEQDRLEKHRSDAAEKRKVLSSQLEETRKELSETREKQRLIERDLHKNTPLAIKQGLEEIARLMQDPSNPIPGIYGPLIELFKPTNPRYNLCIDVIGGNQLFNVVVKDEKTAAAVIRHLNERKAGRVTLVPLTRLSTPAVAYPQSNDCRPLMSFLHYDKQHEPAIAQVFSRVLLCRNAEVALNFAKDGQLTCVTLDGDTVERKGALRGGHIEASSVRLSFMERLYQEKAKEAEAETRERTLEQQLATAKQEHDRVIGEEEKARAKLIALKHEGGVGASQADTFRHSAEEARRSCEAYKRDLAVVASEITKLQTTQNALEAELASEFGAGFSAAEEAELESLSAQLDGLNKQLKTASLAAEKASKEVSSVQSELNENIEKRLRDLKARLHASQGGTSTTDTSGELQDELKGEKAALARAEAAEKQANDVLSASESAVAACNTQIAAQKALLEKANTALAQAKEALEQESRQNEKLLEQRRAALRKKEECTLKLREVGALNAAELEQVAGLNKKKLVQELAKVNEELSSLPGVNKKAAEQYASFTEQRSGLLARKKELDEGDASIRALIRTLDAKKDEAIMRTFDGVTKHFGAVFRELVPKGKGSLHLLTALDAKKGGASDEEEEELDEDGAEEAEQEEDDDAASAAGSELEAKQAKGKKKAKGKKAAAEEEEEEDGDDEDEESESKSEDEDAGFRKKPKRKGAAGRKSNASKASTALTAAKSKKGGKKGASAAEDGGEETAGAAAAGGGGLSIKDLKKKVDTFTGVKVRVSFTDGAPVKSMSLLSGGQKSLVALALIFAIQRTDPAPFYLFDEADGALDQVYRSTVASLLRRTAHISAGGSSAAGLDSHDNADEGGAGAGNLQLNQQQPAQIILTTFSPELANVGDRFFMVTMDDVSRLGDIRRVDKSDALGFIDRYEKSQRPGGAGGAGAAAGAGAGGARGSLPSSAARSSAGSKASGSDNEASGAKRRRLEPVSEDEATSNDEEEEEEDEEDDDDEDDEAPAPKKATGKGAKAGRAGKAGGR